MQFYRVGRCSRVWSKKRWITFGAERILKRLTTWNTDIVLCIDFVKLTWSAWSSHKLETRINKIRVSEISDRACYTSARESANFLNFFYKQDWFWSIHVIAKNSSVIVNGIVSNLENICQYFKIVSFNVRHNISFKIYCLTWKKRLFMLTHRCQTELVL